MTALRLTPMFAFGSRRALRMVERNLLVYKHGWLVLFSGFFEPLFYLLSIWSWLGNGVPLCQGRTWPNWMSSP